jgi:hypothetical protein
MGRVKAMIMDQEEKLDEYVWFIVSECETFQEFSFKVKGLGLQINRMQS